MTPEQKAALQRAAIARAKQKSINNEDKPNFFARAANTVADVITSAESGARRGVVGMLDAPGALFSFAGDKLNDAAEFVGVPSEMVDASRATFDALPFNGTQARDIVNATTGNSLEYKPRTQAGEYAQTSGEFLPASMNPGGSFVAHTLAPGIASEFVGQQTEGMTFPENTPLVGGQAVEPYARGAAAIASPFAAEGVRRAITPNPADPARIAAAGRLSDEGVNTTAGQKTGSKPLMLRESASSGTRAIVDDQNEQFTAAALRRIKARDPETLAPATRATPEVLRQASDDIGEMFDEVAEAVTITPTQRMADDMLKAEANYKLMTAKANVAPLISVTRKKIQDAIAAGEPVSGVQYQQWRSQLSKALIGSDQQLIEAASRYIDILDRAAENGLVRLGRKDLVQTFSDARRMWGDYKTIVQSVSGAGDEAASGIINPRNVRGAVSRGNAKTSYATGQKDLGNLARDGNAVIAPLSDPAQDSLIAQMVGNSAMTGTGATGLAYALTRDPAIAGAVGAASTMAPVAASRFTGSPAAQAYLANQWLPQQVQTFGTGTGLLPLLSLQGNEERR